MYHTNHPPNVFYNHNYQNPFVYPAARYDPSPRFPQQVYQNPKTITSAPEKPSYWRCFWMILLLALLLLLVVAAVVVPLLIFGRSTESSNETSTSNTVTVSSILTTTTTAIVTSTTTTTTASTTTTITTVTATSTTATTTTAGTTVCSSTAITTTVTSAPLPAQCSTHTVITDNSRRASVSLVNSTCDQSGPMTSLGAWFRFSGGAGTMLATCAIPIYRCSTDAPGWYSGVHPSAAGGTINGTVCYHWSSNTCNWSNWVLVTNCNGYYVYFLRSPPVCSLRYCTV